MSLHCAAEWRTHRAGPAPGCSGETGDVCLVGILVEGQDLRPVRVACHRPPAGWGQSNELVRTALVHRFDLLLIAKPGEWWWHHLRDALTLVRGAPLQLR